MKTSPNDVSNREILQALNGVQGGLKTLAGRFDGLEKRFDGLEPRFDGLQQRFDGLDQKFEVSHHEILDAINDESSRNNARFIVLEKDIAKIKTNMVTKDYLDDKLSDLKSDIIQHTRKEIEKSPR